MGMSAPGEIHRLQAIARPTVRLVTNVAAAHLEGTGSLDGVARCKQELFDGARAGDVLLVNQDDPRVAEMPYPKLEGLRLLRYGQSNGCDISLRTAVVDPSSLDTLVQIETPRGAFTARLSAPGQHIALDALAAAAVGHALGLGNDGIAAGLNAWKPIGMRMRVEHLPGGITVLNDAYNANPASVCAALKTLAALPGRRIALLGDMLELGADEARAHREICTLAGALALDLVGLAGPRMLAASSAASGAGEVVTAVDAVALGRALSGRLRPGDTLLVKGSRDARMERVLQVLSEPSV
jgi:UDP-N-acetylmuramoyl-tripeptide--D-alanyl-D-alanine ligase